MGPSGAGKTTFLDIVAGRAKSGTIGGRLLVNGGALASAAALQTYRQYVCAYVMQDDCLPPYLTAAECVLYAAKLRLPVGMPLEEKQERVEEVRPSLAPCLALRAPLNNSVPLGGGVPTLPPPPHPLLHLAKFSSGPSADQKFSLAASAPIGLAQVRFLRRFWRL